MSDQPKKIKVTDRRMFTPDGNLRDEFKDLKDAAAPSAVAEPRDEPAAAEPPQAPQAPPARPQSAAPPQGAAPQSAAPPQQPAPSGPMAADPADEPTESGAAFYDLVAMLAQSASVYLSQASQQLERRGELLEMSRMHIDLLSVLERKTRGNLSADEKAMLEDAIYRLRMALVELGG
ncbi:MAG: DUF1844 domain-containing protein [Acidobacteriota bacterium]